MSVVLDKLGLTRPAASISDCRPSARPRFWPKTRDPGGCVLPPRFRPNGRSRPAHAGAEAAARPAARRRVSVHRGRALSRDRGAGRRSSSTRPCPLAFRRLDQRCGWSPSPEMAPPTGPADLTKASQRKPHRHRLDPRACRNLSRRQHRLSRRGRWCGCRGRTGCGPPSPSWPPCSWSPPPGAGSAPSSPGLPERLRPCRRRNGCWYVGDRRVAGGPDGGRILSHGRPRGYGETPSCHSGAPPGP